MAAPVRAWLGIALLARFQGKNLSVPAGSRLRMVVGSLFNVTAWMRLASIAMRWLSVGEAAMIIYTMPIWANILAWPISGTKPKAFGVSQMLKDLDLALAAAKEGGSPTEAFQAIRNHYVVATEAGLGQMDVFALAGGRPENNDPAN